MTSPTSYATEILADGFVFLEGPRWRDGALWVSDMQGGAVYRVRPDGGVETLYDLPARPSGIGFLPDGTPLIVSMRDRRLLRDDGDGLRTHAELGGLITGDPNDMVVDAAGRAYIGDFGFDLMRGAPFKTARLVMVSPDGAARVAAEDLSFPNGAVILPGGGRLVVAESYANRLTAFDIAADGGLSNRRLYADLGDHDPDGICIDQEGAIWVAAFATCAFLRVLEGGRITHKIDVADRFAVACQLGGADGRTLFCLTTKGPWEDVAAARSQSRIEVARVDAPGLGFA